MLKIKDNVDLKELEKFGFHYEEINETGPSDKEPFVIKQYSNYERYCDNYPLYIQVSTRIIEDMYSTEGPAELVPPDLIYDLIKADLIEKVEE